MICVPNDSIVRRSLTIKRKVRKEFLVDVGHGRTRPITKTVQETEHLFEVVQAADNRSAVRTHQGFWKHVKTALEEAGHTVEVLDYRRVFPPPDLGRAVGLLLEPQRPQLVEALMADSSGLIGAPTRWGKSYVMAAICAAYRKLKLLIPAPGTDLCHQLLDLMVATFPGRAVFGEFEGGGYYTPEIGKIDGHAKTKEPPPKKLRSIRAYAEFFKDSITVCSMDSLHKQDHEGTDLVLVDEPHAIATDGRAETLALFRTARKLGFGATLKGRFDNRDALIVGLIGPVISNVTYREAVDLGVIAPLKVLMVKVPFTSDLIPAGRFVDRQVVYDQLLFRSARTAQLVKKIVQNIIPADWQVMAFINDEKQAEFYMKYAFPSVGTIAMAKRMKTEKEREDLTRGIAEGKTLRVLASKIYVQGLTFPDLKVVINLAGGGANTTAIQKPGRLLQRRPGKRYGVMIDFMFECTDDDQSDDGKSKPWRCVVRESWTRYQLYNEIGYDVSIVRTSDEVLDVVSKSYES